MNEGRYASEDLPQIMEQVKTHIVENGLNLEDFEIELIDLPHKVRVESHGEMGGFIYNLFSTWDFESLKHKIEEWGNANRQT